MHPYIWMPPVCLNAPICLDSPVCLDALHMFGHTAKWLDAPCMFGCPNMCEHPHMSGHPPVYLDTTHMFGCPQDVWKPPACLDGVWMPSVHTQHKESMLCYTKGCPYAPYTWMPICLDGPIYCMAPCMFECPHMCEHPPVLLDAPICLDTPCMFG